MATEVRSRICSTPRRDAGPGSPQPLSPGAHSSPGRRSDAEPEQQERMQSSEATHAPEGERDEPARSDRRRRRAAEPEPARSDSVGPMHRLIGRTGGLVSGSGGKSWH